MKGTNIWNKFVHYSKSKFKQYVVVLLWQTHCSIKSEKCTIQDFTWNCLKLWEIDSKCLWLWKFPSLPFLFGWYWIHYEIFFCFENIFLLFFVKSNFKCDAFEMSCSEFRMCFIDWMNWHWIDWSVIWYPWNRIGVYFFVPILTLAAPPAWLSTYFQNSTEK